MQSTTYLPFQQKTRKYAHNYNNMPEKICQNYQWSSSVNTCMKQLYKNGKGTSGVEKNLMDN
jgi:hypothetical protein